MSNINFLGMVVVLHNTKRKLWHFFWFWTRNKL